MLSYCFLPIGTKVKVYGLTDIATITSVPEYNEFIGDITYHGIGTETNMRYIIFDSLIERVIHD